MALGLIVLGALLALAPAAHAAAEPAATGAYLVVRTASSALPLAGEVGDVLVIDGTLEIAGVVRGHLFSLDSRVVVRSSAVVLGSMTIQRGVLEVEEGAVLPETISLRDAKLVGAGGEVDVRAGQRALVGRLGVRVELDPTRLSTAAASLMKSVLPFDRFAPAASTPMSDLESWAPGLGLELKRDDPSPATLTVGGVTRLKFVSEKVQSAFQRGYRGARGTVLLSGVALAEPADAEALFDRIASVAPSMPLSVKSTLGGGAHWFFIRKGRAALLWRTGSWFFAVETKLAADRATSVQEKQFSDQVIGSLRARLLALEAPRARRNDHAQGVSP